MKHFVPQPAQRTHCATCGAVRAAHDYTTGACPVAYRPDTLAGALRELAAAQAAQSQDRVFVARGEVQRLLGHRTGTCWPLCSACALLGGLPLSEAELTAAYRNTAPPQEAQS